MNYNPLIADIEAVNKTLLQLKENNKKIIIEAVEAVYFPFPDKPLSVIELKNRCTAFASAHSLTVKAVYKYLKEARFIFCDFRQLTTDYEMFKATFF